jgi:hypothetical protein
MSAELAGVAPAHGGRAALTNRIAATLGSGTVTVMLVTRRNVVLSAAAAYPLSRTHRRYGEDSSTAGQGQEGYSAGSVEVQSYYG